MVLVLAEVSVEEVLMTFVDSVIDGGDDGGGRSGKGTAGCRCGGEEDGEASDSATGCKGVAIAGGWWVSVAWPNSK